MNSNFLTAVPQNAERMPKLKKIRKVACDSDADNLLSVQSESRLTTPNTKIVFQFGKIKAVLWTSPVCEKICFSRFHCDLISISHQSLTACVWSSPRLRVTFLCGINLENPLKRDRVTRRSPARNHRPSDECR